MSEYYERPGSRPAFYFSPWPGMTVTMSNDRDDEIPQRAFFGRRKGLPLMARQS